MNKLNSLALGYAAAIVSAVCMLLLGISANFGFYTGAALMMKQWHMFFSFSPVGIFTGAIEAAIISFVFAYALAWIYNKFV